MNVNLTPSSEANKASSVAKSTATGVEAQDNQSSTGFFAQLHSLIFGAKAADRDDTEQTAASAQQLANRVSATDHPAVDERGEDAEQTVGELSSTTDDLALLDSEVFVDPAFDSQAAPDSDERRALTSDALERKAAQAISEGDQLLGRLQQANQTLNTQHGKGLPTTEMAEIESNNRISLFEAEEAEGALDSFASLLAPSAIVGTEQAQPSVARMVADGANESDSGLVSAEFAPAVNALSAPSEASELGLAAIPWRAAVLEDPAHSKGFTVDRLAPQSTGQSATAAVSSGLSPHLANDAIDMLSVATPTASSRLSAQASLNPESLMADSALLTSFAGRGVTEPMRSITAESGQEGLAEQIAAAGLTGPTATLPRAEPNIVANPASALHLHKDLAAEQMAERVQMMLSKNLKNIDIRLDPPEMGRLQIRLNMQGDGANVHFTVANSQARDLLEQTLPRLREMLAQQGVQLGESSVKQQSTGQQQNWQQSTEFAQTSSHEPWHSEEKLDTDIKLDLNVATKRDGISYYA
ncbi:flagellar hook-length control protein FliK [Vibrio sp. HDW18]|uniref:flagellar hook-length control protein FliK n=1 Tax=Vibrio sp. HDW18 TaxID=2714948 RepID=UPI001408D10A|nr:flagellar hook-length control protein FliK [Vibrio sp. HDW18]QIL84835.1 flagellar hook-length control protein FliK [Vibrio sp. HDW18]